VFAKISIAALIGALLIRTVGVTEIYFEFREDLLNHAQQKSLPKFCKYSHELRRDSELAFYGSEDLTPSEFYTEEDAKEAFQKAKEVVEGVSNKEEFGNPPIFAKKYSKYSIILIN